VAHHNTVAAAPMVASFVCKGYLMKQGAIIKNWKRRWFEIEADKLTYRKDQKVCVSVLFMLLSVLVLFSSSSSLSLLLLLLLLLFSATLAKASLS
jgi:hypothetical protein